MEKEINAYDIFLNMDKLTKEEQNHVFSLLPKPVSKSHYLIGDFSGIRCNMLCISIFSDKWVVCNESLIKDKNEVDYKTFVENFHNFNYSKF